MNRAELIALAESNELHGRDFKYALEEMYRERVYGLTHAGVRACIDKLREEYTDEEVEDIIREATA